MTLKMKYGIFGNQKNIFNFINLTKREVLFFLHIYKKNKYA
jgi:hypothetical protein